MLSTRSRLATRAATPDDPQPLIAQGVWHGEILRAPRGDGGFGYDPLFKVAGFEQSAAELDPAVKNRISHRALALQVLNLSGASKDVSPVQAWLQRDDATLKYTRSMLAEILTQNADYPIASVAVRRLAQLAQVPV